MFRTFKKKGDEAANKDQERIPPGQYLTEKFPVLHYGEVPHYPNVEADWDLKVWGSLAEPAHFSFEQFRALPTISVTMDIHCVTRWSKLDTTWEGVRFRDFLQQVPALDPATAFVVAHAEYGFTANVPLDIMMADDALLAYRYDGKELEPEHGYPLRLLVPGKYFWKSAKWLRGLEFLTQDQPGFWEGYGYHNNADPWQEERYAD